MLLRAENTESFVNFEMPVMNGPKVLEALRGDKKTAQIPVVFLTGHSDKDSVIALAMENEDVKKAVDGKNIVKQIYVPNKLVNIVAK